MKQRLLLILLLPLFSLSSRANGTLIGGIYYEFDDETKTASVTYTGDSFNADYNSSSAAYKGNITIPASVTYKGTSYPVNSIGENAFWDCKDLTSIVIPNSVVDIKDYAFLL
ncbi:MAG: leucine-rich repeat protein [Bacteroidaceae bacterium]|nr:leucine-rich repeat protein [Bacteroidaceae bacterium]